MVGNAEGIYPKENIKLVIEYVFKDLGVSEEMIAIAKCESGLNNTVNIMDTNNKRSKGIFQLNGSNAVDKWEIPYVNAMKARELYLNGGFNHWKNCARITGAT